MKNLPFFLIYLFCLTNITAQSVYNFETENIPYQDLTGSTSLNNGQVWDDPAYTIPIGFDFELGTFNFSTIYIVEWGLGGALSSSSTENGVLPIIVPIGQDIYSREDINGNSISPISYKLEGALGNQILKIEWRNIGFFDDSTEDDYMNIQLWLYEGSNIIEYHYGDNQINNPDESFEGETGPYVSLFTSYNMDTDQLEDNAYVMSGNPMNPTVLVYSQGGDAEGPILVGSIPNGTVYRFVPEQLSVNDNTDIQFSIYPNPTSSYITISTSIIDFNVTVYNAIGQRINILELQNNKLDVSQFTDGIYFIKIENDYGGVIKKFIKN